MRALGAQIGRDGMGASVRRPRAPRGAFSLFTGPRSLPAFFTALTPIFPCHLHVPNGIRYRSVRNGVGRPTMAMSSGTHNWCTVPRNCSLLVPTRVGGTTRCTFTSLCETSHRRMTRTVRIRFQHNSHVRVTRTTSSSLIGTVATARILASLGSELWVGTHFRLCPAGSACGERVSAAVADLVHTPAASDEADRTN